MSLKQNDTFCENLQETERYRFNDKGHVHELCVDREWRRLTGVTSILQVIAKPALISWAANMASDYIRENLEEFLKGNKDTQERLLLEAKSAHRKKKEEAGSKGTDIHAEIEKIIKKAIVESDGYAFMLPDVEPTDNKQILHFLKWSAENKVKFLESEAHIYSEKLFLAGICDFVCEIEGQIWIGDIKTSSGIYPEFFFQTAGYQLLFEDMGKYKDIKGHLILNLKKTGEFEEKRSISNSDNRDAFLAALKIYRVTEKINGQIL